MMHLVVTGRREVELSFVLERRQISLRADNDHADVTKPKRSDVGVPADLHTFVSQRSPICGSSSS